MSCTYLCIHIHLSRRYRILHQTCERKTALAVWSRTHESLQRNFQLREKFFLSSWMSSFPFMQCKKGQREVASRILWIWGCESGQSKGSNSLSRGKKTIFPGFWAAGKPVWLAGGLGRSRHRIGPQTRNKSLATTLLIELVVGSTLLISLTAYWQVLVAIYSYRNCFVISNFRKPIWINT